MRFLVRWHVVESFVVWSLSWKLKLLTKALENFFLEREIQSVLSTNLFLKTEVVLIDYLYIYI